MALPYELDGHAHEDAERRSQVSDEQGYPAGCQNCLDQDVMIGFYRAQLTREQDRSKALQAERNQWIALARDHGEQIKVLEQNWLAEEHRCAAELEHSKRLLEALRSIEGEMRGESYMRETARTALEQAK